MRILVIFFAIIVAMPPTLASHSQTDAGHQASFDHVTGNEWWVEVDVEHSGDLQGVDARDDGGDWVALEKRDWGVWAASFHIEPGHDVQFRAHFSSTTIESCWFTHPDGVENCSRSDPRLAAATYISTGHEDMERVWDVAVDGSGHAYAVGNTRSTETSVHDALIQKYDMHGQLVWSTTLAGNGADIARGVALDEAGALYITGRTSSTDLPADGWQEQPAANDDAFVAKLDPAGDVLWLTYIGGSRNDMANAIGVDAQGQVVVGGLTNSGDFPTHGAHALQPESRQGDGFVLDGWITRLTADGNSAVYSTFLGGENDDMLNALVVQEDGSVIATGVTGSDDFPLSDDAADTTRQMEEAFITRLDDVGRLVSSTYLGGQDDDEGTGIVFHDGAAVVTGDTRSIDFPTTSGAVQPQHHGQEECERVTTGGPEPTTEPAQCFDLFIVRQRDGAIEFGTYYGDTGNERASDVAVGPDGRMHVTGALRQPEQLPEEQAPVGPGGGFTDSYRLTLAADGATAEAVYRIGGSDGDWGEAVAVAPNGSLWIAGWTWSDDAATTPDAEQRSLDGSSDGYLARFPAAGLSAPFTFDHTGSNEWWVQVRITGDTPSRVQAMDTGDAWHELSLRDWGDWAASFHIEPGHDVRFRAMEDGTWHESCWFTHPEGLTPDGDGTCTGSEPDDGASPPPSDPSGFDASFSTPGGNEWWVEVYVDANEPLSGVDARDDGGDWITLEEKDWGAWARSFHVEDGSLIDFRATSQDGDVDVSGQYRWPSGEPVTSEPDDGSG